MRLLPNTKGERPQAPSESRLQSALFDADKLRGAAREHLFEAVNTHHVAAEDQLHLFFRDAAT